MTLSATQSPLPAHRSTASVGSFFWLLVRRDLKVRYAGSTLGGLWNLIHPLMLIAIYMTIFSSLMVNKDTSLAGYQAYGPMTYGVHLCAGLLPWLLFSDVLMRSTGALIENANFLEKVAFPPFVIFLSVFFNAVLIQGAGYLVFLAVVKCMGYAVPLGTLAGLGIMALFGVLGMGLGLILAGVNVFFRDTAQVLAIVMQLLFWFNPIVYPKEMVTQPKGEHLMLLQRVGATLMQLNPFERFISATQYLFGVVNTAPAASDWAIVFGAPVVAMALGLLLFRRMLADVRDCL